jgi:hypothetical protein
MNTENNPAAVVDWEPPMSPTDLIFDDSEPLEARLRELGENPDLL